MATASVNASTSTSENQTVNCGAIIWRQISAMAKMSVGAREAVADPAGKLHFRVTVAGAGGGRSTKLVKFQVALNSGDFYDVKLIEINRRSGAVVVHGQSKDVFNDGLSACILRLFDEYNRAASRR